MDLGHTMTKGIISAVKREIDDLNLFPLLQTDASINPGNSGGPLVNLQGEVVGVNQAIAKGATGISFAIPINNVKEVLKDLKSFGFVRRGYIGVEFYSDGQKGALVTNVIPSSPAAKAGIKIKDRIIEFSGTKIKIPKDLPKAVRKTSVGQQASLKIIRDGKILSLNIIPRTLEKNGMSSFPISSQIRSKIKGKNIPGGFQVVEATASHFKYFNLPNWAKHPIVVQVKRDSPTFKGGLREGDLLFQVNGKLISIISDLKKSIKKSKNQFHVLRYHQRYDKYLLISIEFSL